MTFPLNEMYGYSRLCDRLRSSAIIWKQVSLRSSAIRDLLRSSAIVCDHDRRIAGDRRSVFPYDRRRSQNFLRSAICDPRSSAIIWKPAYSVRDFISANYQHSQNLQTEYVDTLKQQNTRTEQETFEQLSLKMSHKHKFAAYIDDNCLR